MLTSDYCSEGDLLELGGVAGEEKKKKKQQHMRDIRTQWFGTIKGVAVDACFGGRCSRTGFTDLERCRERIKDKI